MKLRVMALCWVGASTAIAAAADTPAPGIPLVEETGQIEVDCDKRLGAFQFASQRYEAKVKAAMHTWEDVANYHSTRADWLQCVSSGQVDAIQAERQARNALIVKLNTLSAAHERVNEEIRAAEEQANREILAGQEQFAECDRAPLPAAQALTPCGPQAFIQACAASTVKRLFAKENARSGGPREHVLRSHLQQHLLRRVGLLECVAERNTTPAPPLPEALLAPPAPRAAAAPAGTPARP